MFRLFEAKGHNSHYSEHDLRTPRRLIDGGFLLYDYLKRGLENEKFKFNFGFIFACFNE